jgi:hypothetical protein
VPNRIGFPRMSSTPECFCQFISTSIVEHGIWANGQNESVDKITSRCSRAC